jgi:hypothetical protein
MIKIGFLYNCSMKTNPRVRLSPSLLNRAALIDATLRESGMRIFLYSPKHVSATAQELPGYLLEDGRFVATTAEIPAVNGNWTYQTRRLLEKGMGYRNFVQWTEKRGIGIYAPYAFSELIADKYETYKLVRGYHENLHPLCERYDHSTRQLRYFTDRGRSTFIKPRTGSKGNRIITVRRDDARLLLTYYEAGARQRFLADTVADARTLISGLTEGSSGYVIEHGVETLPYEGGVFDIRVVMIHDGEGWNWIHEARLSPAGSDLSNISQGGETLATEDLLFDLLGAEATHHMLQDLRNESFGLAAYLERLHPGDVMEVAFDFVIDRESKLQLVEINTKPGLASIGFLRTVRDKRPGDEALFERWVYPHTSGVARFLMHKVRLAG